MGRPSPEDFARSPVKSQRNREVSLLNSGGVVPALVSAIATEAQKTGAFEGRVSRSKTKETL